MNKRGTLLSVALLVLFLVGGRDAGAAPLPPLLVVNHETKTCSEIMGGDECMDCFPPEGWEILGFSSQATCPAGYTVVQGIDYTCQPFKVQFCCTEGHSGAHGDCEDLIVNDRTKQCAFVEDIHDCTIPQGWAGQPDNVEPRDWACPSGYEWVADPGCATATAGDEGPGPTPTAVEGGTQGPGPTPTATEGESQGPESTSLPCLGAVSVGPAVFVLWLLIKGRR